MIADRLLGELERLWKELAGEEPEGVIRAAAMTLIVVTGAEETPEQVGSEIAGIMRSHPNRSIVVRLGGANRLDGRVLADCWRPFGQREQICSERIELEAAGIDGLAPVLTALTAPDLPVIVWSRDPRMIDPAEKLARQIDAAKLIVNSEESAHPDFDRLRRCATRAADLSWTAITPERDRIAEAFDDRGVMAQLGSVNTVLVSHGGSTAPASAIYAAAWVRNAVARSVEIRFARGAAPAIELRADSRLVARAERGIAERSQAELLSEELSFQGRDAPFEAALKSAAELAGTL